MSSAGQIVGGIVGGVVGWFAGGPTGATYGAQLGMMAGGIIDPPDGPTINGPRLDDLSLQTSTYGAFIPRNYGMIAQTGNIFWLKGNALTETPRVEESGGKGGPTTTTNLWDYSATFALGLCEGPIDGVGRIWINGQLFYDASGTDLTSIMASSQAAELFTLYNGSDTQNADPLIQADKGAANVPAYRGLAYIVFENMPLAKYNNSLAGAQIKVEIIKDGTLSGYPWLISSYDMAELQFRYDAGLLEAASIVDDTSVFSQTVRMVSTDGTLVSSQTAAISKLDGSSIAELYPCHSNPDILFQRVPASGTADVSAVYYMGSLTSRPVHPPEGDDTYYSVNGDCVDTPVYVFIVGGNDGDGNRWISRYDKSMFFSDSGIYPSAYFDLVDNGYAAASEVRLHWSGTHLWALLTGGYLLQLDEDLAIVNVYSGCPGFESRKFVIDGDNFVADTDVTVSADCHVGIYRLSDWALLGSVLPVSGGSGSVNQDIWPVDAGIVYANSGLVSLNPVIQSASTTLSSVVESECLSSALLTAGDLDVTDLTDTVRGYRIATLGALRGGIEPLRAAWPFDVVQHGYQIKFKRRGSASVASITADELDARSAGENPGVQITNSREMDTLLPSRLRLNYIDAVREYDTNEQISDRGL